VTRSYEKLGPYVSQALGIPAENLDQAFAPAVAADLPGILALRQAVAGQGMWWDDEAFVRWRYLDLRTATDPTPYWIFKKDNEIIGACGLEPVVLVVDGEARPAMRMLDIMVRPDFDGLGLGAFMNMVLFKRFPTTTVTGSNQRSSTLISRMFHHTVDFRFWKAVIECGEIVEQRLKLGVLSPAVAAIGDLLLAVDRLIRRRRRRHRLEIRELARFDDQVTELSRRLEIPGRIMVRRSAEYLNWRFVYNPRCRHRLLGGFVGDQFVGYIVTRFNRDRPNPRKEAEIVDWLALETIDDDVSPLPLLMSAGLDQLVREGAHLVSCAEFDEAVKPALRANGFRLRPDERMPFFVQAGPTEFHRRLASGQGWFLTRGDFDVE